MEENISNELLKSLELPSQLQGLLPSGYSYKLKKWVPHGSKPNNFEATILANVYTDDEAQDWWHEFNNKSNTTMRVRATCPKTGKVNTFKIYLRCLHQGRAEKTEKTELDSRAVSSPTRRNTNCPAGMIIAIRRHIKYSRSKMRDPVDPVHPCEIQLRFVHNHPTDGADSLRFRPVSRETEEKLLSLFQSGHSPASALETLKIDLQVEYGSSYSLIVSDRYRCPDKSFCYRLYYKHFGKDFALLAKKDLFGVLNSKVMHYNAVLGETCVNVGVSGNDLAIAVCTPLMKRAHSLRMSGDVVYVDSFDSPSSKERSEHHVQLLIAHTAVGGIPLGVILTTSKSSECLTHGFRLLKELLPGLAFYGRGAIGPYALLVDDSESLRLALNATWTESDIIACSFRILQTTWRWLWDEKHILKDHRLYLLYLFKVLLFASNEAEMNDKYRALCSDAVAVHYPMYLQLASSIWEKKIFWGLCYHQHLPLQGANNYYEAAVRALKDRVFDGAKTFNLVQMLNYTVTRMDLFYKTKILDILNGKVTHVFRTHFKDAIPAGIIDEIKLVAGNYFLVPGESLDGKIYTVDAELNVCSCSVGMVGALCLHQFWVFLKMNPELFKVGYSDEEFRQKLFLVVLGSVQSDHQLQTPIEPSSVSLPHVSVECSTHPEINLMTTEPAFKAIEDSVNCSQSGNASSPNLQGSHELGFIPSVSSYSQVLLSENGQNDGGVGSFSNDEHGDVLGARNEDSSLSPDNTPIPNKDNVDESLERSDDEKRMDDALSKFDRFCDLIKCGLKTQPKDFLPALEIMLKNVERKGYSSDVLVSGLSFFGVMSAQPGTTMKQREEKKKPVKESIIEEIVPKVHGRQMITYGRKRLSAHNMDGNIVPKSPVTLGTMATYEIAQVGKMEKN